jgi:hypothetical protein
MQQQQQQRLSGQVPFSNQGTAAASSINGSGKLPCQQATAACSSIHASSAGGSKPDCIALLAAAQECPPEVLLVLFEPINQVVLSGGNDGLIKVGLPQCWQKAENTSAMLTGTAGIGFMGSSQHVKLACQAAVLREHRLVAAEQLQSSPHCPACCCSRA